MNKKSTYYALVLPSSGFLSGLDIVVIFGVNIINKICLSIIDEIDRRHLMLIYLGNLLSLSRMEYRFFGQASAVFNLSIISALVIIHAVEKGTVFRLFILQILTNKQRVKAHSFISVFPRRVASAIKLFGTSMINYLGRWKIFFNFFIPFDFTAADFALYHARGQDRITRMCSIGIYTNLNSTYI